MKRALFSLSFPLMLGCMGIVLAPGVFADPVYKRTEVNFKAPFEIPGMVLPAGTYVMKLLDPMMDRDIVQFYDPDQKHMYAMVFAIRDYRLQPVDHTVITFEERVGNAPQAIKEWFYPGDNWGEEFVYPKAHPATVAQTTPPPAIAPQLAPAPKPVPPPKQAATQPAQPVQVAQAQPTPQRPPAPAAQQPTPAPKEVPKKELPKTASDLPLAAMLGAGLVLVGLCLRRRVV